MKKLLIFLIYILFVCNAGSAKTIDQRLESIEKRLENIENSLKFLDLINNLSEETSNSSTKTKTLKSKDNNKSKVKFELLKIGCEKEDFSTKLKIYYILKNDYQKTIKLIDANFIINNLFDEKLYGAKILRSAYVDSKKEKKFSAQIDKTFDIDNSCSKLEQSSLEDYKIIFRVDKIAFEDNSILNFK